MNFFPKKIDLKNGLAKVGIVKKFFPQFFHFKNGLPRLPIPTVGKRFRKVGIVKKFFR